MSKKTFAMIADGDVFHTWTITLENNEALTAGVESAPIFVDITDKPEVTAGWTYDGINFIPPIQ
jgi:hypothetical protein